MYVCVSENDFDQSWCRDSIAICDCCPRTTLDTPSPNCHEPVLFAASKDCLGAGFVSNCNATSSANGTNSNEAGNRLQSDQGKPLASWQLYRVAPLNCETFFVSHCEIFDPTMYMF